MSNPEWYPLKGTWRDHFRQPNGPTQIVEATIDELNLLVRLSDGRAVGIPLIWFPTLERATPAERQRFHILGG